METTINIFKTDTAIQIIQKYSQNEIIGKRILIKNLHLKKLNKMYGRNIFKKNDASINSETLWASTQPFGIINKKISHNTHNLKPKEIVKSLQTISKPLNIIPSYYGRFIIITMSNNSLFDIAVVIDPKSENLISKEIENKIITIFPKFK